MGHCAILHYGTSNTQTEEQYVGADTAGGSDNTLRKMIDLGADVTGRLASACIAALDPSVPGGFAAAAAGPLMKHTLIWLAGEFVSRSLSRREQLRAGATVTYAVAKIRDNLLGDKPLRSDGFFNEDNTGRSSAEEIAEGVVLAAQRDHEEKKLRAYGNLLGNLAFCPQFSRAHSNLLIRLAEKLSYRQLCLLALFHPDAGLTDQLKKTSYLGSGLNAPLIGILQEIFDLTSQELVWRKDNIFVLEMRDVIPTQMRARGSAYSLVYLMELLSPEFLDDVKELVPILQDGALPPVFPMTRRSPPA